MKAIVSMKFIVIDIKRAISLALALFLVIPLFTFYTPSADALGTVWVKEFYTDKFGDKTSQYYLTNKSQFKGTYNSDSITKGKLGAKLIFERNGEYLSAYITLFLKGKEQVKNGTPSAVNYDISVKRSDGNQFETAGRMVAGDDKIKIDKPLDLADSIIAGDIDIYMEVQHNANNNFLFKVNSGNYKDIYNQEIFVPYQEEKYQEAEALLTAGDYDAAATVFKSLGNYKDSAARADEAIETKYEAIEAQHAEAYAAAEALLTVGDYDAAVRAFEKLGDYKDSAKRIEDVYEAKNAEAYAQAEDLLAKGKYDEAEAAFRGLGDFRDSRIRISDVVEAKNESAYQEAAALYDSGEYALAYEKFRVLKGYKDVDKLLSSDNNLLNALESKLKPYKTVGSTVSFGAYEQDNNINNGKEPIEWIVLKNDGNQSLLISRYVLAYSECNKRVNWRPDWVSCSLREWLKYDFMKDAFSKNEQEAILLTNVDNPMSQPVISGNESQDPDKIFLLSSEEAKSFFQSDSNRACESTTYAVEKGAHDGYCTWWLRTWDSTYVAAVDSAGCIRNAHAYYFGPSGVRPAFWINLESDIF